MRLHQHRALKIRVVHAAVENADLRRGVGRQGVQYTLIGAKNALPILVRRGSIVDVGKAPRLAVPCADLPHTALVDVVNGDRLLHAARNGKLDFFAALGSGKRFNQNRHAPFDPMRYSRNSPRQSRARAHREFVT